MVLIELDLEYAKNDRREKMRFSEETTRTLNNIMLTILFTLMWILLLIGVSCILDLTLGHVKSGYILFFTMPIYGILYKKCFNFLQKKRVI